ncbi:MAG: NAD(P)/FAD-dependent oxidoreductase, partial [Pseudomonadota bacterium]
MSQSSPHQVAVIGAGPAGLMAADVLVRSGRVKVTVYDAMPSPARKFLLAGRGGLNLTHSESIERFLKRYSAGGSRLSPTIDLLPPEVLRAWCEGL